ncbi:uncharacterized protein LOC108719090 [Xenopus laevis]|uniref:Uncharacterized protein LOC108719090 n=1 Tax=Xenopus laevis TaxID=8355 RepID=A0A8J0VGY0_XENLA|nr:uncharacterized protein LOC108719090 [Xenopus laevis]
MSKRRKNETWYYPLNPKRISQNRNEKASGYPHITSRNGNYGNSRNFEMGSLTPYKKTNYGGGANCRARWKQCEGAPVLQTLKKRPVRSHIMGKHRKLKDQSGEVQKTQKHTEAQRLLKQFFMPSDSEKATGVSKMASHPARGSATDSDSESVSKEGKKNMLTGPEDLSTFCQVCGEPDVEEWKQFCQSPSVPDLVRKDSWSLVSSPKNKKKKVKQTPEKKKATTDT